MEARYLYSVVRSSCSEDLGDIGISEKNVYTIPYKNIAAVVHSCAPQPYDTRNKRQAEEWILEHSYVIDQATIKFGTVLPFSFDVLIRGDDSAIREWLGKSYTNLNAELDRLKGLAEYSIQIYYDYDILSASLLRIRPDLSKLKDEIDLQPKGKAYLLKRQLDLQLKDLASEEASRMAKSLFSWIEPLASDLNVEKGRLKNEAFKGMAHLASFVCLISHENAEILGEMLEVVDETPGFGVRFTGPWAPFSFVQLEDE